MIVHGGISMNDHAGDPTQSANHPQTSPETELKNFQTKPSNHFFNGVIGGNFMTSYGFFTWWLKCGVIEVIL